MGWYNGERKDGKNMSVIAKDLYGLVHYLYGVPYTGSLQGMRYYVAREPLANVFFEKERGEATLMVKIWRGPLSYDKTPAEEMIVKEFPFEEASLPEIADYLNAMYEERPDYWAEGKKLL